MGTWQLVDKPVGAVPIANKWVFAKHQEFGQVLLTPRELMSPVVSGYEWHNLVTTPVWAHYASGHSVGTHEVIQPAIHCISLASSSNCTISLYDLFYDAWVFDPVYLKHKISFNLNHTCEAITVCYSIDAFLSSSL